MFLSKDSTALPSSPRTLLLWLAAFSWMAPSHAFYLSPTRSFQSRPMSLWSAATSNLASFPPANNGNNNTSFSSASPAMMYGPPSTTTVSQASASFSTLPRAAVQDTLFSTVPERPRGLKAKLLQVSNWASLLCVLDCTLLPLITVALPLLTTTTTLAVSASAQVWIHEWGHRLALWFVLPVGGMATTLNYSNHRQKWIASLGYLGLFAVWMSNVGSCGSGVTWFWGHGSLVTQLASWGQGVLHLFHHGLLHRATNLTGCFLLMLSNFCSHRATGGQGAFCLDPNCFVDHDGRK